MEVHLLSGDDLDFLRGEFREFGAFMDMHRFDEDGPYPCHICGEHEFDEDTMERALRAVDGGTLDADGLHAELNMLESIVLHHENDYIRHTAGFHEEHDDGWVDDDDEYEAAFAKWRRLLAVGEALATALLLEDRAKKAHPMFTEPRRVDGAERLPETVGLAGFRVPKAQLDAYVESVEALYRMSKIAESRDDPRIAAAALSNRVAIHKVLFERFGLDHDGTGERENALRKAIDAYTEECADVPRELAVFTR